MYNLELDELEGRLELSEQKRIQLQKKLTQKTVDEDIPLWSMVDLMTLLLIFFLFFYTTAIKGPLSASQDFPEDSSNPPIEPSAFDHDKTEVKTLIGTYQTPASASPLQSENENSEQTIQQFREDVLETMDKRDQDVFSVSSDQHRLIFVLGERITFTEGQATLRESYQPIFVRIADFISAKHEYQVVVSGHTDTKPIRTKKFPSNLDLSSARAITVAKFLIENGVSPHRVSIQAFSEYHPLFENITPENRQKNRRVEITLIKEQDKG